MFKRLKLGPKFFLSLMLIAAVPLLIVTISNYFYSKNEIETRVYGSLRAVNDSRTAHINHVIQLRQEQAKQLAGTFIARQLKSSGVNEEQLLSSIQSHIESIYYELKRPTSSDYKTIDQESSIENISVWDIYGKIVANTNRSLIGKRQPDTFLQILYEKGAYFQGFGKDPLTNKNQLTILEEIRNWQTGEYSGVILLKYSAKVLNDITSSRKGLGKTAETYIVDKDYYMITESRFSKNAILRQKVNTKGVDACFNNKEAPIIYANYKGQAVLGVQQYLKDQKWCVISEIDVQEAYVPIVIFRNRIIVIASVLFLVVLVFVHLSGRAFVLPIGELRDASLKVAGGNYDLNLNIKSQDELGELAKAFDQMAKILESTTRQLKEKNEILEEQKEELKKLDVLKSEFVSTVSHELRTPMTIIKDSVMQLLEEYEDISNEDKNMLLEMALRNINRLADLINNLLDLSKIEAGKIDIQKSDTNIALLAKDVCFGFESQAKKKNLEMKFETTKDKIIINIDPDKITQVFFNLIGNSMKFVEKGYVKVSIAEDEQNVVCAIEDTGRGISKDDLKKVFSKFQQFGQKDGAGVKGTGLGLSICKGLVDLHQGDIWVESELNKGTKFIFTLPKKV